MHVYQLVEDSEAGYIFYKDNRRTYCPFVAPYMIPGKIQGTMDVQRMSCNTTCPLCNVFQKDTTPAGELTLTLACGAGDIFEGVKIVPKGEANTQRGALIKM